MNPLNFTRMEWWGNKNPDGLGHACAGFMADGSVHLTFDIRKTGGDLFPVFSNLSEVGGKYGHRREAYKHYRALFDTLDGYSINEMIECDYGILYDLKTYKFVK
jgi:hypothetical protein